ncbi:glycosyltransferase, partial [Acidilobus sp.]|uniref:glycosyltransferase n=1 Tax=Acidilobus sp. TaxID=1872109 RepID=UPI003D092306
DKVRLDNAKFPYVEFGRSSDETLAKFYENLYAFVYTSYFESFGLPPLGAMACGTPVVIIKNLESLSYARHGYNSLIIEERSPESVAAAVSQLLDNPTFADELYLNARRTAASFRFDDFMRRFKACVGLP